MLNIVAQHTETHAYCGIALQHSLELIVFAYFAAIATNTEHSERNVSLSKWCRWRENTSGDIELIEKAFNLKVTTRSVYA